MNWFAKKGNLQTKGDVRCHHAAMEENSRAIALCFAFREVRRGRAAIARSPARSSYAGLFHHAGWGYDLPWQVVRRVRRAPSKGSSTTLDKSAGTWPVSFFGVLLTQVPLHSLDAEVP